MTVVHALRGVRFAFGTLLVVAGSAITSSIAADARAAPGPTPGGFISGMVVDATTGMGSPNARLEVFRADGIRALFLNADAGGTYITSALVPGVYFVTAKAFSGTPAVLFDGINCPIARCPVTGGTPISVKDGATTTNVNFVVGPEVRISGRLTNLDGVPLAFESVELWDSSGRTVNGLTTDLLGEFAVGELLAGTYFAAVRSFDHLPEIFDDLPCLGSPGIDCDPTEGTPITVDWGGDATGIDFEVAPLGTLSGLVTDAATGLPLAGTSVLAFADPGQASYDSLVFTDQAGMFTMFGLLPRSYHLLASKAGYLAELYDDVPCALGLCDRSLGQAVAVPLGVAGAGIDFELARQGSLSGTVRNARTGEPLAGTFVRFALPGRFNLGAAMTNSHGRYLLNSVPPGGVFVYTTANPAVWANEVYEGVPCYGDRPADCALTDATPVDVPLGGEVAEVDFDLEPYLFWDGFEFGDVSSWSSVVGGTP